MEAQKLLFHLSQSGAICFIPSHGFFEQAVATIVHFKNEPRRLEQNPVDQVAIPNMDLQVIALDKAYAVHLLDLLCGAAIPDLKSQDLIYFCIARDKDLTLLTGDRRLRNVLRKGGLRAFHVDEATKIIGL